MQRYRIKYAHSATDGFQTFLVPDDDGDLCKYADVEEEFERIVIGVAEGKFDKAAVAEFFRKNSQPYVG